MYTNLQHVQINRPIYRTLVGGQHSANSSTSSTTKTEKSLHIDKETNIINDNEPPEPEVCHVDYINVKNNFSGARFLRECCTKVNANALTMATAATYYHKFFAEASFEDYDPYLIASTCIYLASKMGNDDLKIRDIINVSYHCIHRKDTPLGLDAYFDLRDSLVEAELLVMRMLGFDLSVDLPHKHLLLYINALKDWMGKKQFESVPIIPVCWTILFDTYHIPIVLTYSPQLIAATILYLTFQIYGVSVPGSSEVDDKPWYSVLHPDCKQRNVWNLTSVIIKLYSLENQLKL